MAYQLYCKTFAFLSILYKIKFCFIFCVIKLLHKWSQNNIPKSSQKQILELSRYHCPNRTKAKTCSRIIIIEYVTVETAIANYMTFKKLLKSICRIYGIILPFIDPKLHLLLLRFSLFSFALLQSTHPATA